MKLVPRKPKSERQPYICDCNIRLCTNAVTRYEQAAPDQGLGDTFVTKQKATKLVRKYYILRLDEYSSERQTISGQHTHLIMLSDLGE